MSHFSWLTALVIPAVAVSQAAGSWSAPFHHDKGFATPGDPNSGPNGTNPFTPFPGISFPVIFGTTAGWPDSFNAVHMALIPKGLHRGRVLVWNIAPIVATVPSLDPNPNNQYGFQGYSIVDPRVSPVFFRNYVLPIEQIVVGPNGPSAADFFCAAQTWSPFGDLAVVGGTRFGVNGQNAADNVFVMDPSTTWNIRPWPFPGTPQQLYTGDVGLWVKAAFQLASTRYYPTLTLTHRLNRTGGFETFLVLGGTTVVGGPANNNPTWNSYEAMVIAGPPTLTPPSSGLTTDAVNGQRTFAGPATPLGGPNVDDLFEYPRAHLLSDGTVLTSGYPPLSGRLDHETTLWDATSTGRSGNAVGMRHYGSSLRFPNLGGSTDIILRLGGSDVSPFLPGGQGSTNSVEYCDAGNHAGWVPTYSMNTSRYLQNAVILPTGDILVIGGVQRTTTSATPVLTPELLMATGWVSLANGGSTRDYHSTAVLLEDGRVFVGGGNARSQDYEIFSPPYLTPGLVRPANVTITDPVFDPAQNLFVLSYGAPFNAKCDVLPLGVVVQKAVLMAPGSTTHHSDMNQRYYEMSLASQSPNKVQFKTPQDDRTVPRGIYMLFLVTNIGTPSVAIWVRLP